MAQALDELVAGVRFLTRVPVPGGVSRADGADDRTGAAAFGLVGLGVGTVAALPLIALGSVHPAPAAILALALLAILSGALHLDGLADTADAIAAPVGGANRARTDPRIGSAGAVALIAVLALDATLLVELLARGSGRAAAAFVAATAISRAAAPVWAWSVGRRRATPASGLGRWFADRTGLVAASVAAVTAVIATVALAAASGSWSILAALAGPVLAGAIGGAVVAVRRQLDGDGYGALVEVTFAAALLTVAVVA